MTGAVLAGFLVSPSVAHGFLRRYHAMECAPQNPATSTIYHEGLGLLNNGYGQATFVCPVVSDDFQPHQVVQGLTVHGHKAFSNGTSDGFTVCVKYWSAAGFACAIDTATTSAGPWGLTIWYPSTWYFDSGANFPYIKVFVQPGSGIFGVFVTN